MARMKPPIVPEVTVPVLRESEIAALFKACEGKDFLARRDMAIFRAGLDTGCRLAEKGGAMTSAGVYQAIKRRGA